MTDRPRILVKEQIADSGVDLLREHFDVDLGADWSDEQFRERLPEYDGILIRSATKMTEELIELGTKLRVIGRAGVGVNNVDVPAATKRGVIVVNAPQSNVVTAAEHTFALLLSLARKIPQAHASLTGAQVGAHASSTASRSTRRRSGSSASAASASSSRSARAASACTSSPSTPSSRPTATASSGPRRRRTPARSTRRPTSSRSTCR